MLKAIYLSFYKLSVRPNATNSGHTYFCSCKGFMYNGYICSHVLAVLHNEKLININQMMSRIAPRSSPGRPPQRLGALSRMDSILNIDMLTPGKWRHQTLIRPSGIRIIFCLLFMPPYFKFASNTDNQFGRIIGHRTKPDIGRSIVFNVTFPNAEGTSIILSLIH